MFTFLLHILSWNFKSGNEWNCPGQDVFPSKVCLHVVLHVRINERFYTGFSRRSKTGRDPEIVVDGHACMRKWYDGLDWTIGLEMQELIQRMRQFVESLTEMGVKLTFYFGGVHADHKYDVWRNRQNERIEKNLRGFDFFSCGGKFSFMPEDLQSFPASMGVITSLILKYVLKCTVSTVLYFMFFHRHFFLGYSFTMSGKAIHKKRREKFVYAISGSVAMYCQWFANGCIWFSLTFSRKKIGNFCRWAWAVSKNENFHPSILKRWVFPYLSIGWFCKQAIYFLQSAFRCGL